MLHFFQYRYDNQPVPYAVNPVRWVQFILCTACLALAIYLIALHTFMADPSKIVPAVAAAMFTLVTLADLFANCYMNPINWHSWVFLAIAGVLTFFLGAGFLIGNALSSTTIFIIAEIFYIVTGIVFLVDVIVIILFFKRRDPSVYPDESKEPQVLSYKEERALYEQAKMLKDKEKPRDSDQKQKKPSDRGKERPEEKTRDGDRPDFKSRRRDDDGRGFYDDRRPEDTKGPRKGDSSRPWDSGVPRRYDDRGPGDSKGPRRDDGKPWDSGGPRRYDGREPGDTKGPRREDGKQWDSGGPRRYDGREPGDIKGPRRDDGKPWDSRGPRRYDSREPGDTKGPRRDDGRPWDSGGLRRYDDREPGDSKTPRRDDGRPWDSGGPRRLDDREPEDAKGQRRDDGRPWDSGGPRRSDDRELGDIKGQRRDDGRPWDSGGPRRYEGDESWESKGQVDSSRPWVAPASKRYDDSQAWASPTEQRAYGSSSRDDKGYRSEEPWIKQDYRRYYDAASPSRRDQQWDDSGEPYKKRSRTDGDSWSDTLRPWNYKPQKRYDDDRSWDDTDTQYDDRDKGRSAAERSGKMWYFNERPGYDEEKERTPTDEDQFRSESQFPSETPSQYQTRSYLTSETSDGSFQDGAYRSKGEITSYGGTFPMGRNAAPLPSPEMGRRGPSRFSGDRQRSHIRTSTSQTLVSSSATKLQKDKDGNITLPDGTPLSKIPLPDGSVGYKDPSGVIYTKDGIPIAPDKGKMDLVKQELKHQMASHGVMYRDGEWYTQDGRRIPPVNTDNTGALVNAKGVPLKELHTGRSLLFVDSEGFLYTPDGIPYGYNTSYLTDISHYFEGQIQGIKTQARSRHRIEQTPRSLKRLTPQPSLEFFRSKEVIRTQEISSLEEYPNNVTVTKKCQLFLSDGTALTEVRTASGTLMYSTPDGELINSEGEAIDDKKTPCLECREPKRQLVCRSAPPEVPKPNNVRTVSTSARMVAKPKPASAPAPQASKPEAKICNNPQCPALARQNQTQQPSSAPTPQASKPEKRVCSNLQCPAVAYQYQKQQPQVLYQQYVQRPCYCGKTHYQQVSTVQGTVTPVTCPFYIKPLEEEKKSLPSTSGPCTSPQESSRLETIRELETEVDTANEKKNQNQERRTSKSQRSVGSDSVQTSETRMIRASDLIKQPKPPGP